jgi:hypothetical protein
MSTWWRCPCRGGLAACGTGSASGRTGSIRSTRRRVPRSSLQAPADAARSVAPCSGFPTLPRSPGTWRGPRVPGGRWPSPISVRGNRFRGNRFRGNRFRGSWFRGNWFASWHRRLRGDSRRTGPAWLRRRARAPAKASIRLLPGCRIASPRCRCTSARFASMAAVTRGASPWDGSSMSRRRGRPSRALARASIRCSPPASRPARTGRRPAGAGNTAEVASRSIDRWRARLTRRPGRGADSRPRRRFSNTVRSAEAPRPTGT